MTLVINVRNYVVFLNGKGIEFNIIYDLIEISLSSPFVNNFIEEYIELYFNYKKFSKTEILKLIECFYELEEIISTEIKNNILSDNYEYYYFKKWLSKNNYLLIVSDKEILPNTSYISSNILEILNERY